MGTDGAAAAGPAHRPCGGATAGRCRAPGHGAARDRRRAGWRGRNSAAGPGCWRRRRAPGPRHAGGIAAPRRRTWRPAGPAARRARSRGGWLPGRGPTLGEAAGDGAEAEREFQQPRIVARAATAPRRCGRGTAASGGGRAALPRALPIPLARSPARARAAASCRRRRGARSPAGRCLGGLAVGRAGQRMAVELRIRHGRLALPRFTEKRAALMVPGIQFIVRRRKDRTGCSASTLARRKTDVPVHTA